MRHCAGADLGTRPVVAGAQLKFPISETSPVTWPGPPPQAADVVVVGGGVIGVCTALFLARAGQKVVLCEKGRIAGEQSSRNWGWIRQAGRDPDELPVMAEANRLWRALAADTNTDIGLREVGVTYLAKTDAELEGYRDWLKRAEATGTGAELLTRRQVAAQSPGLSRSYLGGLHVARDLRAEPFVAVPALAAIAARAGAVVVENCAVRTLDRQGGAVTGVVTEAGSITCQRVVVAGGAWSALFLRAHGVSIPQLSVRASVAATLPLPDIGQAGTLDDRVAWRRRDDGGYTLAAGGFHELFVGPDALRTIRDYVPQLRREPFGRRYLPVAPMGYPDHWLTPRRWDADEMSPFERVRILNPRPNMGKLWSVAREFGALFPNLGPVRIAQAWAGMLDVMPDEVPVVDVVADVPGLLVGTGFSGHGFGIGPGMGRVLADLAMGRDPGHDMRRFRLSRFSDGSEIRLGPSL